MQKEFVPSPNTFKTSALKAISTILIWAVIQLLTKWGFGAEDWRTSISQMTQTQRLVLLAILPLAWLMVEFIHACFVELVVITRAGGKTTAQAIGQIPNAIGNTIRKSLAQALALLTRWLFTRKYRQRLCEDYGLFNDRGLGLMNAARLDLLRVYVDLQIAHQNSASIGALLKTPTSERLPIWHFLKRIRPGIGLVLVGAPGSGKTTLLQYLLLIFASKKQAIHRQKELLPILIELRTVSDLFSTDATPQLTTVIRSNWKKSPRIGGLMKHEPQEWLERQLRSTRVLLLLDGLDEVPQTQRPQVSAWVQSQMRYEDYRYCLFIMTSRPLGYASAPLADAAVLEVQPFSKEQISKFIDGWYLANEEVSTRKDSNNKKIISRRARDGADALRLRLRENPNIHELTVNPLLLTMVCMVHRYHGALPGSRSQLYGEICQVLLERWRHAKDIPDELGGEHKLAVLRPLAHEFMRREARVMSEQEIVSFISEILEYIGYSRGNDPTAGNRFLLSIQSSSGLLLEKEKGFWSFAHKTLQEYLAAEHWLRKPEDHPSWISIVGQDWWRESILLYAARADASDVVNACLDHYSSHSWSLAFQCLNEAHGMRPEIRSRGEANLRDALHSEETALFVPAARSMHHFQQLQTRPISEVSEQRITMITQAEYQLFLNELSEDEKRQMIPPHWKADKFVGSPMDPVLGVWPWQAQEYVKRVNRGVMSESWRLPEATEEVVIEKGLTYWCNGTVLPKHRLEIETLSQMPFPGAELCFPSGLKRGGVSFDLGILDVIADALGDVLQISSHQSIDLSLAIAHSLNVALARTFLRNSKRAHELAHTRSFDLYLVTELIFALGRDPRAEGLLTIRDRNNHASRAGTITFASSLLASVFNKKRKEKIRTAESQRANLKPHRDKLLICLRGLLDEQNRWSDSAYAWRTYASFLLNISIPSLIGNPSVTLKLRNQISEIEHTMRLINDRATGLTPPYEGIVLVRDKAET